MKKSLITLLAATAALAAAAVPAKRGIHTLTQPDGTTIDVLLCGDEHRHLYMTPDSLPLQFAADGFLEYARFDNAAKRLSATGVRATANPAARTSAELSTIATIDARATRRAVLSASIAGGD